MADGMSKANSRQSSAKGRLARYATYKNQQRRDLSTIRKLVKHLLRGKHLTTDMAALQRLKDCSPLLRQRVPKAAALAAGTYRTI